MFEKGIIISLLLACLVGFLQVESYSISEFINNRETGQNIYTPAKSYQPKSYESSEKYPRNFGRYDYVQSYYSEFPTNRERGGNIYRPVRNYQPSSYDGSL